MLVGLNREKGWIESQSRDGRWSGDKVGVGGKVEVWIINEEVWLAVVSFDFC